VKNSERRYRLVVSAVNLVEGGTLRVLQEFVESATRVLDKQWEVIALVNNTRFELPGRANVIAVPWPKRSWLGRLYFEWFSSRRMSKQLGADVWVALHDITPNVVARRKVVYCHNATPFYKASLNDARYDLKFWLFSKFYGYLYGIGIQSNDFVVVQQDWLRRAFANRYGLKNVMVAYPAHNHQENLTKDKSGYVQFVYPALPRPFKNFETICEAARLLEGRGEKNFRIVLTIAEGENAYATDLVKRYGDCSTLQFVGRQTFDQMRGLYRSSDCLIFPSRLETWGLPISEAKSYGLDILLAEEPYAREAIGTYANVSFFPATDAVALAGLIRSYVDREHTFNGAKRALPQQPFVDSWDELVVRLCQGIDDLE
jgi:glycosyltransferase involved in cell wall biosynthesis